jgi:hypothetical protein
VEVVKACKSQFDWQDETGFVARNTVLESLRAMPGTMRGKDGFYVKGDKVCYFVKLESGEWKARGDWVTVDMWWEEVAIKHMEKRPNWNTKEKWNVSEELELTDLTGGFTQDDPMPARLSIIRAAATPDTAVPKVSAAAKPDAEYMAALRQALGEDSQLPGSVSWGN